MESEVIIGDCAEVLKQFPDECIDSIITDPPYGISFMGKEWDKALPSLEALKECNRVLKSGAFGFFMCAPRMDVLWRMGQRLEEAGFRVDFSFMAHCYASGFPKSMNMGKNIGKLIDNYLNNVDHYCIWKTVKSLENAKHVEQLYPKNLTDAGLLTDLKNIVVGNVVKLPTINELNVFVNTAEKNSCEAQAISETLIIIAAQNVDLKIKPSTEHVLLVDAISQDQNHSLPLKICIVPTNVSGNLCESIMNRIKDEEAPKTENGNKKFWKRMDINALCVEVIETFKHIILNQLNSIQNSDTNFQTGLLSATNVIITKSIMECLITNTVNIVETMLGELQGELEGSYASLQLKPAVEVIIPAMKPLSNSCKTFLDQAISNQKGISWLDDCKIPFESETDIPKVDRSKFSVDENGNYASNDYGKYKAGTEYKPDYGRFPANLLCSDNCLDNGIITKSTGGEPNHEKSEHGNKKYFGGGIHKSGRHHNDSGSFSRYFSLDAWFDKKLQELPEHIQKTFPFLITPKPSKSEKNKYIENKHPTVKPLKLMSYLITLGSREGDVILDPFAGSGTTLEACKLLNRVFIGIDKDPENEKYMVARGQLNTSTISDFTEGVKHDI